MRDMIITVRITLFIKVNLEFYFLFVSIRAHLRLVISFGSEYISQSREYGNTKESPNDVVSGHFV